jgi:hypothetical protein
MDFCCPDFVFTFGGQYFPPNLDHLFKFYKLSRESPKQGSGMGGLAEL